jgi:arginase family enzyme
LGKIPVESWLTPKPDLDDELLVNTENYSTFIDANGCKEYASHVKNFVQRNMDKSTLPLMIGIDHSMTGGVLEALSEIYGAEKLSVIVLDSHFDAIPTSIRYKLFTFSKEAGHPFLLQDNFYLEANLYDPLAFERPDTYNKGTFLYYMIKEGIILPSNLWVIGTQDYPIKEMLKKSDPRIQEYADAYLNLEKEGVKIITKEAAREKTFEEEIGGLKTPFVYISFDVDVGCGSAITMTRYLPEEKGLNELEIYDVVNSVKRVIKRGERLLVGLDFMEIDVHKFTPSEKTPNIVSNVVKRLFW